METVSSDAGNFFCSTSSLIREAPSMPLKPSISNCNSRPSWVQGGPWTRQRWNRGVNNHNGSGKNVPLDLEVEHDNNAIKEGIRKLGPNLTYGSVSRCARMLPVARATVHNVAKECNLMKRSGKHFVKTTRNDLTKLVNLLVQEDALSETPGRCYRHFKNFPRSPLRNLRMGKLCQWINKHKHELQIGRRARWLWATDTYAY